MNAPQMALRVRDVSVSLDGHEVLRVVGHVPEVSV